MMGISVGDCQARVCAEPTLTNFRQQKTPYCSSQRGVESQRFVLPARVCRVGPVHFVGFVVEADEEGRRHNDIRFQTFVEVLFQQILIPGDEVFPNSTSSEYPFRLGLVEMSIGVPSL